MNTRISVVILNYKNKGLIRQQLKHYFDSGGDFSEIIVVDNDSGDGIEEMLTVEFPQVKFIQTGENRGYAFGNNVGIKHASGSDYVLIANPDIVFTQQDVDTLVSYMDTHEQTGIAGPKLINADNSLQYSAVRYPDIWLPLYRRTVFAKTRHGKKWLDWYFMKDWDHDDVRSVDWLFGACLIVRKSAMEKVGLLDERFFLYLEDTDWCRRFWEHGFSVDYIPQVSLVHLHKRSSDNSIWSALFNKSTTEHLKSFGKYLLKYRGKDNPHSEVK